MSLKAGWNQGLEEASSSREGVDAKGIARASERDRNLKVH